MTASTIAPTPLAYNGERINYRNDMLCLTDMWRAAGSDLAKQPAKWRGLPATYEFIEDICGNLRKSEDEIFETSRGGRHPGTWAHWQIGLAYAKYLSPAFHKWGNEVVRERIGTDARTMTPAEAHLEQAKLIVAMERRQLEIESKQQEHAAALKTTVERLDKIETASDHFTCIGYARCAKRISIDTKTAAELGRRATRRALQLGIKISKVPDPRFGAVSQYPKAILDFVWEECFPPQTAILKAGGERWRR